MTITLLTLATRPTYTLAQKREAQRLVNAEMPASRFGRQEREDRRNEILTELAQGR